MNPTGAQTRFTNDRVKAAKQQLSSNAAAANTMKTRQPGNESSGATGPSGPPVGNAPPGFQPMLNLTSPPNKVRMAPSQGPSQTAQGPGPSSDGGVTRLIHELQFNKLIKSPKFIDTSIRVKMRNLLNDKVASPQEEGSQLLDLLTKDS